MLLRLQLSSAFVVILLASGCFETTEALIGPSMMNPVQKQTLPTCSLYDREKLFSHKQQRLCSDDDEEQHTSSSLEVFDHTNYLIREEVSSVVTPGSLSSSSPYNNNHNNNRQKQTALYAYNTKQRSPSRLFYKDETDDDFQFSDFVKSDEKPRSNVLTEEEETLQILEANARTAHCLNLLEETRDRMDYILEELENSTPLVKEMLTMLGIQAFEESGMHLLDDAKPPTQTQSSPKKASSTQLQTVLLTKGTENEAVQQQPLNVKKTAARTISEESTTFFMQMNEAVLHQTPSTKVQKESTIGTTVSAEPSFFKQMNEAVVPQQTPMNVIKGGTITSTRTDAVEPTFFMQMNNNKRTR